MDGGCIWKNPCYRIKWFHRIRTEQRGFSSNLLIRVASSAPFQQPINTLNSHWGVKCSLWKKGGQSNRTHNTTTPPAPSLSSQCFITQLLLEFRSPGAEIKKSKKKKSIIPAGRWECLCPECEIGLKIDLLAGPKQLRTKFGELGKLVWGGGLAGVCAQQQVKKGSCKMNSSNPGQSHLPVTHKPCERRHFVDGEQKQKLFSGCLTDFTKLNNIFFFCVCFFCFANKCAYCAPCALCLGFRMCMTEADVLMLVSHKAQFNLLFMLLLYWWH